MECQDALLTSMIFAAAVLYSCVGHGGGSGYLAAMALFGLAPETMKPAALALNVLVSAIALARFLADRSFPWRLFWPLAAGAVPCAFLGGCVALSAPFYKGLVGVLLLVAACRLLWFRPPQAAQQRPVSKIKASCFGAGIGLLSGLTGVGGGIYLTPILLLAEWADARNAAGISAAFILANSVAGLAGHWLSVGAIPHVTVAWGVAVVVGGTIGSTLGSRRLSNGALCRVLGLVLLLASLKFSLPLARDIVASPPPPDAFVPRRAGG